jgi:cob(I)alamin adenosyltransferase
MAKKIYTKTGDQGLTSLLGGTKVPKNDWRIEAYGTVDELNSFIGLLGDKLQGDNNSFSFSFIELEKIQNNLFKIGSVLSYDMTADLKIELPNVTESDVKDLEEWMDTILIQYFRYHNKKDILQNDKEDNCDVCLQSHYF